MLMTMLSTSQKYILSGPLQKKFANICYPHTLISMLIIIHLRRNSFLFYKYQIIPYTCVLVLFTQYSYPISAWYSIMWTCYNLSNHPHVFLFILPHPPFFSVHYKKQNSIIFKWTGPGSRFLYLILYQLGKSFNSSVLVFKRKIIIVFTP